ncbi:4663_t:CDS:2, partial [Ambispora leptoticha]
VTQESNTSSPSFPTRTPSSSARTPFSPAQVLNVLNTKYCAAKFSNSPNDTSDITMLVNTAVDLLSQPINSDTLLDTFLTEEPEIDPTSTTTPPKPETEPDTEVYQKVRDELTQTLISQSNTHPNPFIASQGSRKTQDIWKEATRLQQIFSIRPKELLYQTRYFTVTHIVKFIDR